MAIKQHFGYFVSMIIATTLCGCANLYPPQAEKEITLKAALLDTVDSLNAMKSKVVSSNQRLNMYVEDVTAEFYVKGARVQNTSIEATATIPNLVIKPSYSLNDTGERSNKITIKFKNIVTLPSGAGGGGGATPGKPGADNTATLVENCLADPKCITAMEEKKRFPTE